MFSCGNQDTENKKLKLSPNELYNKKVDATCTIITDSGQGSGFFIDSNIIVTNYHVIANSNSAQVILNNESKKYEVLGYLALDKINDLVLLMVAYKSKFILEIEKDIPNPGDHVFAISTPIGLSKTFSDGLISGKKNFDGRTLIQTTVSISHGSSGCPIMNEFGDVVGIAVGAIEEGNNLNFCIPTSYLLNLIAFKESFPTSFSTILAKVENEKQDKSQSIQNPNSQNNGLSNTNSSPKETKKIIFMKSNEIVTNDYIKNQLLNSFYNDKHLSFFHENKSYYNIDYNSVQFFEYEKSCYYESPLYKTSHCIKYLITFTRTNEGFKRDSEETQDYYQQFFLDDSFNVVDSWATYDEKEKQVNWWASFKKENYNTPCE